MNFNHTNIKQPKLIVIGIGCLIFSSKVTLRKLWQKIIVVFSVVLILLGSTIAPISVAIGQTMIANDNGQPHLFVQPKQKQAYYLSAQRANYQVHNPNYHGSIQNAGRVTAVHGNNAQQARWWRQYKQKQAVKQRAEKRANKAVKAHKKWVKTQVKKIAHDTAKKAADKAVKSNTGQINKQAAYLAKLARRAYKKSHPKASKAQLTAVENRVKSQEKTKLAEKLHHDVYKHVSGAIKKNGKSTANVSLYNSGYNGDKYQKRAAKKAMQAEANDYAKGITKSYAKDKLKASKKYSHSAYVAGLAAGRKVRDKERARLAKEKK